MAAKDNLTKMENIDASIREIDFVSRFASNWKALMEVYGIMRPIKKAPGTKLTAVTATVTLEDGHVAEGDEIPYSLAEVTPVTFADLELEKFAKAVSIEAVVKYGASVAVQKTDDAFLEQLQRTVQERFFNFLKTGTLIDTQPTFQAAVAMANGNVINKFQSMDKDYTSIVTFVNTLDAYKYLGAAELSVQTLFGIQYIENFMGADRLILSSHIPENTVIATPTENIDLYYIDPSDAQFDQLNLNYRVDGELPLIGFSAQPNYSHAVGEVYALMGMALWAEYLDGIAVTTIGTVTPKVVLDKTTAEVEANKTITLTATTIPADATVTWTSDDTDVATVAGGVVTGVAEGTATITASITVDGESYTATCEVTVTES